MKTKSSTTKSALGLLLVVVLLGLSTAPVLANTLDVLNPARFRGAFGLRVVLNDHNAAYVEDLSPDGEIVYRSRFYSRFSALTQPNGGEFELFSAYDSLNAQQVRLFVRRVGSENRLRYAVVDGGGLAQTSGGGIPLRMGFRAIEVLWQAADSGFTNGVFELLVDNVSLVNLANLDNSSATIDYVQWGTVNGTPASSIGFVDLDDFTSSRGAGPLGLAPGGNIYQFIEKYYADVLTRAGDQPGLDVWESEINRVVGLGIDVKQGFLALATFFFTSAEYQARGRTDREYVSDLYLTFLDRIPSSGEIDSWEAYLIDGVPRDVLLLFFSTSDEFQLFMEAWLGTASARPEADLITNLYRGFLIRLPDTVGFQGWLNMMQSAQCTSAQAVTNLANQIAQAFAGGGEYALRGRTDAQFIEDLYNAILGRGATATEFAAWVAILAGSTRPAVVNQFTTSPEFQLLVTGVINAGCVP